VIFLCISIIKRTAVTNDTAKLKRRTKNVTSPN